MWLAKKLKFDDTRRGPVPETLAKVFPVDDDVSFTLMRAYLATKYPSAFRWSRFVEQNAEACTGELLTCRNRRVKCDGQRPRCRNCIKGDRMCHEIDDGVKFIIYSPPVSDDAHQTASQGSPDTIPNSLPSPLNTSLQPIQKTHQSYGANLTEYLNHLVSCDPERALENTDISKFFCHYIDFLAPWYDLCESERPFGTILPMRALKDPILFKALIAFSALHKCGIQGNSPSLSSAFHAACVHDLLKIIEGNIDLERRGDYLAATCLLRSYEIFTGDSRKQQKHLMGAYLFSMAEPADMNSSGLLQAGVWNYLREEITVALECRRPVRTSLEIDFDPTCNYSDSMQANIITYLLARIMNYCFKDSSGEQQSWQSLRTELDSWEAQLPNSFEPYSTAEKANNPFPSLWHLQPWHVAAQQYRFVAEILMAISNPAALNIAHVATENALKVCGLAFTNENVAARVNAFGPLAFCGRFLMTTDHRNGIKAMLIEFGEPTTWPVHPIIEDLEEYWRSLI